MEIKILHLIKGTDGVAYIEFEQDGSVKLLSPAKFENRFGKSYKSFMKEENK